MDKNTYKIVPEFIPYHIDAHESNILFLDLISTGLYWRNSRVESLGIIYQAENMWEKIIWSGSSEEDEYNILEAMIAFVKNYTCCINYNGNHFDLPYLSAKLKAYGLEDPFTSMESVDFYTLLKPYKDILKLPSMKLVDLAHWLGLTEMDDTELLFNISSMYAYVTALDGHFTATSCASSSEDVVFTLTLESPLPKVFSYSKYSCYLTGQAFTLKLKVPVENGCIRKYFENYKDYFYLPAEDNAIHKSIASFVDKAYRQKATRETCYTHFTLTQDFLDDQLKTAQYVKEILSLLLS